jgi:hypothetical protein
MNKTGITDPNVREEIMSARQGRMLFLEQNSTKARNQEVINFTSRHQ